MYPLRDARESNPTMGGYDFGEWSTHSNQFHPGIDFNAGNGGDGDLGMPLIAVCKMALRANESTARGYGNHQWWEVLEGPHIGSWLHYCHANSFSWHSDSIGLVVNRGDVIGECGKPLPDPIPLKIQSPISNWECINETATCIDCTLRVVLRSCIRTNRQVAHHDVNARGLQFRNKPLPDPIPLKIQSPISNAGTGRHELNRITAAVAFSVTTRTQRWVTTSGLS